MPYAFDFGGPGYSTIMDTRKAQLDAYQARLTAYDASPTLANDVWIDSSPLIIPVGDETTTITTGASKVKYSLPYDFKVTGVAASLSTASSSGLPTIDVKENGVSILGATKLTIDANEKTTVTAAAGTSITDNLIAAGNEITVDITVAGTGAAGLKVYLLGYRI